PSAYERQLNRRIALVEEPVEWFGIGKSRRILGRRVVGGIEMKPEAGATRRAGVAVVGKLPGGLDRGDQVVGALLRDIDCPGGGQQALWIDAFVEDVSDRREIERRLLRWLEDQGQGSLVICLGAHEPVADRERGREGG